MGVPRVISLVPSVTETVLAWGIEPVACTRFCEQPDLRHVGGTKDPDVDGIVALSPDVVVMDEEENRLEDHDALRDRGVEVHVTAVRSLADVDGQMSVLADRLGVSWEPLATPPEPPVERSAFVPIWRRPWMALGEPTYGASVLRAIGVVNVVGVADGPYPTLDLPEVARRRPDLVVAPSEPYPFAERHRPELEGVAPVRFVDGRDLLWWGERSRSALSRLAVALG